MSNKIVKPLSIAIGAAFIGSLSFGHVAEAANPFQLQDLNQGYQLVGEGSCGEGKCGEGQCGEGEGDKGEEGSCGEGSGGEDKGEEGSCGEGKCGAA